MLRRLSVENYALIDKLEMELDPHLNIITGETGAGKSILLGALGLLLGAKNDGQAMKDATRNCTVEGTFDLAGSSLEAFFAENDLDYAPETTLTRMITPAGKSRAFVNDVPVQLAQLRELGARLLDIHSQHQNLILSSEEFRTSALDTVAANGELLTQYAAQYARLTELRRRLAALREEAANGRRDEEWLRFQTEELTSANLRPGEQAELEEVGAFIGILGARMGYPILDPIASVVICIFIGKAAYDIFKDAVDKMVDKSCDEKTIQKMREVIASQAGVENIDLLQTRLFGAKIYVDIEIAADKTLSLENAHEIAQRVHDAVEKNFPLVKHCMVHVNPM